MKNSPDTNPNRRPAAPLPESGSSGENQSAFTPARWSLLFAGLLVLFGFSCLPHSSFHSSRETIVPAPTLKPVNVSSSDELITLLKEKGLWEITGDFAIPRMILSSYPSNIGNLDTDAKKKAFLNSLLPTALMAMAEVEKEKETLHTILSRIPGGYNDLVLSEPLDTWPGSLSKQDIDTLMTLGLKYRTDRAGELVKRVEPVPLSLLLAQAALESSWGSSRIAREGNNLFGVLTWGDNAIDPPSNSDGNGYRYANYNSILESVRAYIVMLNRLPSYEHFRELRTHSRNPLKLAEGLMHYSERGSAYIGDIKGMITCNDLDRFDECVLAAPPPKLQKVGLLAKVERWICRGLPTTSV